MKTLSLKCEIPEYRKYVTPGVRKLLRQCRRYRRWNKGWIYGAWMAKELQL